MVAQSTGLETATDLLKQAAALHASGRLSEAEQLYLRLLDSHQHRFDVLYGLGVLRLQQSNFKDAEQLLRQAIKADKKSAEAYHYLGFALTGLKQTAAAIGAFKKAVAIKPAFPEAHNNLGYALQVLGRSKEAIIHYNKALRFNPSYAEAHNNLGNALHLLGRSANSIAHYRNALVLRPDYAEARWNLANALREAGQCGEAITEYQKSLTIRPNYVEALTGLAKTFHILARTDEAIAAYEQVLAINPVHTEAILNIADILASRNQQDQAISYCQRVIDTNPENVDALVRRAVAYAALKRHEDAMVDFEKALSLDADNIFAFNGLARSAIAACDWKRTETLSRQMEAWIGKGNMIEPFTLLGYCDDPALQSASAKIYARRAISSPVLRGNSIWRNEKIRIAYVAAGFHQHPTAYLTVELLETHDRSRFEVIGISLGPDDGSDIRARIVRGVDQFIDVRSKTDEAIAKLIQEMQVDILVDRSGYTINSRPGVFARRPAPIQVNYLGFPGSLGAKWYDYIIADRIVLPFDQQEYYTEKIVHLPACYLGSDSKRAIAKDTPSRQQMGLPQEGFVFCCFNNIYKVTAPVFEIWMRLLRRMDGSVLWLLGEDDLAKRNLRHQAARHGIESDRLIFAARVNLDVHLARHRLADLFLDTLPCNAHTTASDALWAGLPVVTCSGQCFAGRVAASLLAAAGLSELVAVSLDDYEALALSLAREPGRLHEVRAKLMRNRLSCALFDTEQYRRDIESAYVSMWQNWQDGRPSRSFQVEA